MKIFWTSNPPFVSSGYGTQTRQILPRLKALGHEVVCAAMSGLKGALLELPEYNLYPEGYAPFLNDVIENYVEEIKPDITISLVDVWVLHKWGERIPNWYPWCVHEDTIISTPSGDIRIKEAYDAEKVLGQDNQGNVVWADVVAFHKYPVYTDIYELQTDSTELYITADNTILTNRGWIPVSCITTKDLVYCNYDTPKGGFNAIDNTGLGILSRNSRWGGIYNNNNQKESWSQEKQLSIVAHNKYSEQQQRTYTMDLRETVLMEMVLPGKKLQCSRTPRSSDRISKMPIFNRYKREEEVTIYPKEYVTLFNSEKNQSFNNAGIYSTPNTTEYQKIYSEGHRFNTTSSISKYFRWQRVKSVRRSSKKIREVFDFTTTTGNFFANRILIHNCPIDTVPVADEIKQALQGASGVISLTKQGQELLNSTNIPSTYIPHGIDTDVFKPLADTAEESRFIARNKLGLPLNETIFLMVADNKSCPSRKAFERQFLAFRKYLDRHPGALLLCHTEPAPSRGGLDLYRLMQNLHLQKHIVFPNGLKYFLGYNDSEMNVMYNACNCLLNNTVAEGFGLPVCEAQATGIPVICTKFLGDEEHCHAGWAVEPLGLQMTPQYVWNAIPNEDLIFAAMESLLASDVEYMAKENRKFMVDNFSWPVVMEKYWKPFLDTIAVGTLDNAIDDLFK